MLKEIVHRLDLSNFGTYFALAILFPKMSKIGEGVTFVVSHNEIFEATLTTKMMIGDEKLEETHYGR